MPIEKVDRTVGKLLDALGLAAVAAQARLARAWPEIVGPLLAAKTCPARLKGGVLTVCAVSSAWAQELSLSRATVLERIDGVLARGTVREVRVIVGPVPNDEADAAPPGDTGRVADAPGGTAPPPRIEGIDAVTDPETREILLALSRKAEKARRGPPGRT